VKKKAPKAI
jgi:myo-inositol-1(or 4)-monophosphatase